MYKCNYCNVEIPDNQAEGRIVKVGPKDNPKFYCMECGEPVAYIPDMPQANAAIHGSQATLISNSDNRITTNNYYGSETSDEQIDTPFGPCRKSEAKLCKQCRQWVPFSFFDTEHVLCDNCIEKECLKSIDEGKSLFEYGLYDKALEAFLKYESICKDIKVHAQLHYNIGRCYFEQKQLREALLYFTKSRQQVVDSFFYIGLCFFYGGIGLPKDEMKALENIKIAADNGSLQAKNFIVHQNKKKEEDDLLSLLNGVRLNCVNTHNKYGFFNGLGEMVIPCTFDSATRFEKDISIVSKNSKKGYIDRNGTMIIECKYEEASHFRELALVKHNGKYGFINRKGEVVVPIIYEKAKGFNNEFMAPVKKDNKWGFVNEIGNEIIPCIYEDAEISSKGLAPVKKEGKWGFVNANGKEIISCRLEKTGYSVYENELEGIKIITNDSENNTINGLEIMRNELWGYINNNGKEFIPCIYKNRLSFKEGLAWIKNENRYGFINEKGMAIVPIVYENVRGFNEGLAAVKQNGKWGFVNKIGREIIPCIYEDSLDFNEGLAAVKVDGKWGFINKDNIVVIDFCDSINPHYVKNGVSIVRGGPNSNYGLVDRTGNNLTPFVYPYALEFSEGLSRVKLNGKYGYIDYNGVVRVPIIYDLKPINFGTDQYLIVE